MKTELREKCELFANNRDTIARRFVWNNHYINVIGAAFCTSAGVNVDVNRMKECRKILKKNAGAFSSYRNNLALPIFTKMALSDNPQNYIDEVKSINKKLSDIKRFSSEYRVLTAMNIYENINNKDIDYTIARTKELMDIIKNNHPFITSSEDLAMVSMLAMTDRDTKQITEDIEACYKKLKESFPMHANSVQALSMVLATSDIPVEKKCSKAAEIYNQLKRKGQKFSKGNELAVIGMLALLEDDTNVIVDEVIEADSYLRTRKGFGFWGTGKRSRLMYAAMLVAEASLPVNKGINAPVATVALMAAIAAMTAIAAASAASAASATH